MDNDLFWSVNMPAYAQFDMSDGTEEENHKEDKEEQSEHRFKKKSRRKQRYNNSIRARLARGRR